MDLIIPLTKTTVAYPTPDSYSLHAENMRLKDEVLQLRAVLDMLSQENKNRAAREQELENEVKSLKYINEKIANFLHLRMRAYKHEKEAHNSEVKALRAANHRAFQALKIREPLVEIGWKIRRRYLERSLQNIYDTNINLVMKRQANRSVIEAGNKAAHGANIKADASLLQLGFLGMADIQGRIAFKTIYPLDIEDALWKPQSMAPRWIEFLDILAEYNYCVRTKPSVVNFHTWVRLQKLGNDWQQWAQTQNPALLGEENPEAESWMAEMRKIVYNLNFAARRIGS